MREEREKREKEEKERNAYSSLYSSMASKYDDEDDDDDAGFSGSISKLMSDSSATRRAARSRVSSREKKKKIDTYMREDDKITSRLR